LREAHVRVGSEIETKFELDESGFQRLKAAGRVESCTQQLNVYFDDNWSLANQAATFRIRFTPDGPPEATLKVPVSQEDATRTMKEIEVLLREHRAGDRFVSLPHRRLDVSRDLPFELRSEILRLGVKSLQRVGWMRNTRYVVAIEPEGQIELDRTILPDGSTVFEAEVESEDAVTHRKLSRFILSRVPWAKPSGMSKFQRFRQAAEAARSEKGFVSAALSDRSQSQDATSLQPESAFRSRLERFLGKLLGRAGKFPHH
jgi:uncharacterized protein YjbK